MERRDGAESSLFGPLASQHSECVLKQPLTVRGFIYTPRKDCDHGRIARYRIHASSDGNSWVLSSKGWVQQTVCATGQSNTYTVGSDGVTTVSLCSGITARVSSRKVDASGKTLAALGLR